MNNIKFKIIRCENQLRNKNFVKIIGLNIIKDSDPNQCIYREITLNQKDHEGKTSHECVETAFLLMSSSISKSIDKLMSNGNNDDDKIIGSYYVL